MKMLSNLIGKRTLAVIALFLLVAVPMYVFSESSSELLDIKASLAEYYGVGEEVKVRKSSSIYNEFTKEYGTEWYGEPIGNAYAYIGEIDPTKDYETMRQNFTILGVGGKANEVWERVSTLKNRKDVSVTVLALEVLLASALVILYVGSFVYSLRNPEQPVKEEIPWSRPSQVYGDSDTLIGRSSRPPHDD
jgi:hypothetical protein